VIVGNVPGGGPRSAGNGSANGPVAVATGAVIPASIRLDIPGFIPADAFAAFDATRLLTPVRFAGGAAPVRPAAPRRRERTGKPCANPRRTPRTHLDRRVRSG
jgi:hypothetical protein